MKYILFLFFVFIAAMLISKDIYKEPKFELLERYGNIEIREYSNYIVAKNTILKTDNDIESNMFRVLASYIFGNNENNESLAMTAPVTTFQENDKHHMVFYMLDAKKIDDLPKPINSQISFENFYLNKCAVISFSWFVNERTINKYQKKLKRFLNQKKYTPTSTFMINRYDSPWTLPFLRRNEILVKIK